MPNGRQSELRVVAEIKKKFGAKIDLDKTPFVILEIIRNFRNFDDKNGGGGGGGGGPGISTIAVGISPETGVGGGGGVSSIAVAGAPDLDQISHADLMREILKLKRSLKEIQNKLDTR